MQIIPLLLLAGMESVAVTLDASSSSIVASVISDDRNDTSFGSLEKFLHLNNTIKFDHVVGVNSVLQNVVYD